MKPTKPHTRNRQNLTLTLKPATILALKERAVANDESMSRMADAFLRRAMGVK